MEQNKKILIALAKANNLLLKCNVPGEEVEECALVLGMCQELVKELNNELEVSERIVPEKQEA